MSKNSKRKRKVQQTVTQAQPAQTPPVTGGVNDSNNPPAPPPLPTKVSDVTSSDDAMPFIIIAVVIVGIVMAIAFMLASNDGKSKTPADDAKFASSSQVVKGEKKGETSVKGDDDPQRPAVSSGEFSSFEVDLAEPSHSEGIAIYTSTFQNNSNELLGALKGLQAYEDMYTFSVSVNSYTDKIKSLIKGMGVFAELKEVTDSLSYIVTQGTAKDGALSYQLYLGVDGSQEVSISYVLTKEQAGKGTETWQEVAGYLRDYIGIDVAAADLVELKNSLEGRVDDGGSFSFVINDETSSINLQLSVSQYGTENEQWNCLGVHLIQDSQINSGTTPQDDGDTSED